MPNSGLFQRRQQLAELPDLAAPGDQPFAQGEQRHAQGQRAGNGLQTEGEQGGGGLSCTMRCSRALPEPTRA
jgi:hypothetical protein